MVFPSSKAQGSRSQFITRDENGMYTAKVNLSKKELLLGSLYHPLSHIDSTGFSFTHSSFLDFDFVHAEESPK